MRIIALTRHNRFNLAVGTEFNRSFLRIKINAAALFPCFAQHSIQRMQIFQMRNQIAIVFAHATLTLKQNIRHGIVSQAGMRAHDTFYKP